jgi:hypothetical protein
MTVASSGTRRSANMIRAVLMLVGLTALARPASASSITEIQGSTQGCFGSGCGVFENSTTDATYGLTFDGASSFDVWTDASGAPVSFALGTFSRGNVNVPDSTPELDFSLGVTFSLPLGVAGDPSTSLTAIIHGTSTGGGGPLAIDFTNTWQLFTYSNGSGTGSFEFAVFDDPDGNKNGEADIIGAVRNATFTPNSEVITAAAVPEPSTMILLGTGVAAVLRRRRTSSTAR